MTARVYVYALTDRKIPKQTLAGHAIEALEVGRVYALAERGAVLPTPSEHALREQHAIVVELGRRAKAILPARFGSLVDVAELERLVHLRQKAIADALNLVRGREQMTVRLIGDAAAARSGGVPRSPAGPGAAYLQARRTAAGYPLPQAAERLTNALRPLIFSDRSEPGQGSVRAVLYHLIERGSSAVYRSALATAADLAEPLTLQVSGPWPPFAFAPELL